MFVDALFRSHLSSPPLLSNVPRTLIFDFQGKVSTLAGGGREGFQDGSGKAARFNYPEGLAYDAENQVLYVVEFVSRTRHVQQQLRFVSAVFSLLWM